MPVGPPPRENQSQPCLTGKPLLAIVGPTAVGKTRAAVAVARLLGGEIVSCDSMQVYRGMDIGTAKPTSAEMAGVPHHLLDVADPDHEFSVAEYQSLAAAAIQDIQRRGRLPLLVGGTGLYLRAVLHDYYLSGPGPDPAVRRRLRRLAAEGGEDALHRQLAAVDPDAAARIHPHDVKRVIRALEVYEQSGRTLTEFRRLTPDRPRYDQLLVGLQLDRTGLYQRINERVDEMMAAGLLAEVRGLLAGGCHPGLYALQSLGYRQLIQHLQGSLTLEDTVTLIKRDTRRFAKRQLSWFRREQDLHWLDASRPPTELVAEIVKLAEGKWPGITK